MSTVRAGGVRFRIYLQDHKPLHAHGHYAETVAIVVLKPNREVRLAKKVTAIKPRDAKRTDVRKILDAAAEHYDDIVTAWERMQDEDQDKGACDDY
jgi:hypothetical protein